MMQRLNTTPQEATLKLLREELLNLAMINDWPQYIKALEAKRNEAALGSPQYSLFYSYIEPFGLNDRDNLIHNIAMLYEFAVNNKENEERNAESMEEEHQERNEKNFLADAQCVLASMIENGVGFRINLPLAIQFYKMGADKNHHQSQCTLGIFYKKGLGGIEVDVPYALRLYEKSIEGGNPAAMRNLGLAYMYGWGVEADESKAVELMERAATYNFCNAFFSLGAMWDRGFNNGGIPDNRKAAHFYQLAADRGHPAALCNLGWKYDNGEGVPKDEVKGTELFRQAALLGHRTAQSNMGLSYRFGRGGLPVDFRASAEWYNKAALQGYEKSLLAVGQYYKQGKGVPKDLAKAQQYKSAKLAATEQQN